MVDIDVRAVIYLGAHLHVTEDQLATEIRALGGRHRLVDDARGYELTDREQAITDELESGASLAELEARHRDVDSRTLQAILYALATGGSIEEVPRTITIASGTQRTLDLSRPPTICAGRRDLRRGDAARLAPRDGDREGAGGPAHAHADTDRDGRDLRVRRSRPGAPGAKLAQGDGALVLAARE